MDPVTCPNWKNDPAVEGVVAAPTAGSSEGFSVPWPSSAMNSSDFPVISARGAPRVINIVGAANAGKTTLLSTWYLLLARGALGSASTQFAGSYTLEGWEHIAHNLRWDNDGGPGFPEHTPSGSGREPGMLHLAQRLSSGVSGDILFSDAPGEWFNAWAIEKDATLAGGARWLSEHADAFVVVADCEALSGPERGHARGILQDLIHRVSVEAVGRPVALVWTKADKPVPSTIRTDIDEAVAAHLGAVPVFEVSVYEREGMKTETPFVALMEWCLTSLGPRINPEIKPVTSTDPFMVYGHG